MPFDESYDFNLEKQRAAQRLRELGARSRYKAAGNCAPGRQAEDESGNKSAGAQAKPPDLFPDIGIPGLGGLKLDPDIILVLGLLLILSAEKTDKLLSLALLYILI